MLSKVNSNIQPRWEGCTAIYHCHIQIISRSQGRSAVAAAAYRSGSAMVNQWDGQAHDCRKKSGIVHSEILLSEQAPQEFSDRATLWNSVEEIERSSRAQLAREVEVALPVELSRETQVELVRAYVQQNFVSAGMCADFSIHDKGDGSPHAHILLTMRPLNADGRWGAKQWKVYQLDANGQKIYNPTTKRYACKAVPTTDWNEQTKAEQWCEAWADACNLALEHTGSAERIDHRSYARQGVDKLPTIHTGVGAVHQARRGMRMEREAINQQIQRANRLLRQLRRKISDILATLQSLRAEPKAPDSPALWPLLQAASDRRINQKCAGKSPAYRQKISVTEMQKKLKYYEFLQQNHIVTVADLQAHLAALQDDLRKQTDLLKDNAQRQKELASLLHYAKLQQENQPVYDAYCKQRTKGKREKFYEAHRSELAVYQMARRELKKRADGRLDVVGWQTELAALKVERERDYVQLLSVRKEIRYLQVISKACLAEKDVGVQKELGR